MSQICNIVVQLCSFVCPAALISWIVDKMIFKHEIISTLETKRHTMMVLSNGMFWILFGILFNDTTQFAHLKHRINKMSSIRIGDINSMQQEQTLVWFNSSHVQKLRSILCWFVPFHASNTIGSNAVILCAHQLANGITNPKLNSIYCCWLVQMFGKIYFGYEIWALFSSSAFISLGYWYLFDCVVLLKLNKLNKLIQ